MYTETNDVSKIAKMTTHNYVLPSPEYTFISTFFWWDSLCVHARARVCVCVFVTHQIKILSFFIIGNKCTKIMFKNSVPIFISK